LVELLVVIGVIAILIAILMPGLRRARSAANRAMCLSNQRQILLGLNLYANAHKQWLPPGVTGGNPSGGDILFNDPADYAGWYSAPPYTRPWVNNGWTMLGLLFYANTVKDPQNFYCPEARTSKVYPYAWESGWRKWSSYMYRYSELGPELSKGRWPPGPRFGSKKVRTGDAYAGGPADFVSANSSIIADHFGYPDAALMTWPHASPWGVCVGYGDGHAQYWTMKKQDNDTIKKLTDLSKSDRYITLMWRAFDTGDFAKARAAFP
jgi:type II secretory pathway pseudopilin PulG